MKKILSLVVSLTLISGVCAAVLAYVDSVTKEPIKEIKVKQEQDAVKAVLPSGAEKIEPQGEVFVGPMPPVRSSATPRKAPMPAATAATSC